ncbi:ATP-binding cassette domain-containing protein [Marinilabiliaceae bacterium ANBcel2]|nr:ATP-binding cassette domain-containing protein [Marinilabiliaceae bacterium ANBcel2]
MSEEIFKALMQLFALVSAPGKDEKSRKKVIKEYLLQQLSSQLAQQYLNIYDYYHHLFKDKLKKRGQLQKRFAASSVRILKITNSINEELTYYQKLIVLVKLLEFLHSAKNDIEEIEIEFANAIADSFNIDSFVYLQLYAFISDNFKSRTPHNNLLIITGDKSEVSSDRFYFWEHFNNDVRVLNIESVNLFLIKAKESNNLTINGQLVQPGKIHLMRPGSSLRYTNHTPITYTDLHSRFYKDTNKSSIIFSAKNISYNYPASNNGIHPMSFSSESGNLVGIMGDSGAGKTTLVNLLTGVIKPDKGDVTINGFNIHNDQIKIKGIVGYVSQDDLLIDDLTVFQNLYYNAKLCFDHLSKISIKRKVDSLLNSLGLEEVRNMKVGSPLDKKISGGQRKRLNIALELIREPSVMFLDEPTSGLSSKDSENIMDLLKDLALKGKLVFVVIHQPSSDIFKMFNQLLVLDNGGYLIYNGDAVEAINYFKESINHINREESECPLCGNVSPEQILTIVNSNIVNEYGVPTDTRKVSPKEWYCYFNKKIKEQNKEEKRSKKEKLPLITFKIPNKLKQLAIFTKRDVVSKLSNRQYMIINITQAPLLAFILSILIKYFNTYGNSGEYIFRENPNITVYIIISVIIAIFIGLSVSAEEIINDRKIRKREAFLSLSRLSYISSKLLILTVLSAIQTGLFVLIGNSIMEIEGMAIPYWITLFSASVFANLLGLNISDSFKKTVNIYILIPFLIIPQLILSGVFVSYDKLNPNLSSKENVPLYGEIIIARWAFEALAVNQYKNNEYQKNFFIYDKLKSKATYRKDFWAPQLINIINRLDKLNKSDNLKEKEYNRLSKLIINELVKHNNLNLPETTINYNNFIDEEKAVLAEKSDSLIDVINNIQNVWIKIYNEADRQHDKKIKMIIETKGNEHLTTLKNRYHNDELERFIRRSNDIFANRIIESDDKLIQVFDPIYKTPEKSLIRAHFLSATKPLGNNQFKTLHVNIAIIWLFNIVLFLSLYYSALNNILNKTALLKTILFRKKNNK